MFLRLATAAAIATAAAAPMVDAGAITKSDITFSSQSVAGSNGTSFVYFQAQDSRSGKTSSVPTRRFVGCPTPYYMHWTNVVARADGTTSYDVQVFDCRTGRLVNDGVSRAGELSWQPGSHPLLAGAVLQLADAQVIYGLNVTLSPPVVKPNQDTSLEAAVADDFVARADRALNISVDPNAWSVSSWSLDFGDGQRASVPGGSTSTKAAHRYGLPGDVKPVVTAHVVGMAQVADFDPATGDVLLLNEPFSVDVTNQAVAQVTSAPVVGYTPPQVRAAVVARLQPDAPPRTDRGLASMEAPRGTPVYIYTRPIVAVEGQITLDGQPAGAGHTTVLAWRLRSGSADGRPGQVSPAGAAGSADAPIVQQWNLPDRIGSGGPAPYTVAVDFTVRTSYPDGHKHDYDFVGQVAITVGYAASSG